MQRALSLVAAVACSACATSGGASPPQHDHEDGAAAPVYQPMLVVPLPALQAGDEPPGRVMEALQARHTPIGDVLLALFKDSDINLLIDPAVQATECTFDIKRSTVEQTFEALLQSLDLGYEWDGNFLRVRNAVRDTIYVDLMEAGSGASGGTSPATGSGGSTGSTSNTSASTNSSFWDEIEGNLPTLLGEGGTFVVNRAASTIHVEGRPSGVRRLRELVSTTMGRANKQVSLEARILEVRLQNEYSLGVNWSLLPGLFSSGKTGLAPGGAVAAQTAASGGTALAFGILDSGDFSVFVDALQQQGQVRVLSSPRVSTMNNQSASINVTDQIPYITREVIDVQGVSRTEFGVAFAQAGVQLQVRPMIGSDGLLSVSITPQVREQTGTVVTPDGLVTVPIISERQATTTVRVADGQAIALGGLRSTRKNETRQGIPFLMDAPFIGQLFSSTVQSRAEVELMIVLVPRVLDDTWIAEEIARGAHRIVQLRHGFQWNSIQLDGYRPEDWSGGSLQGRAQAATAADVRLPDHAPAALPADRGMTVTRRGLANHLLTNAEAALADGDLPRALEVIERALQLDPQRSDALVAAGVLSERHGDRARARILLDRALDLVPDDVVALTARGALEMGLGSPLAAKRFFERAHGLGKTSLTAANLGAALLALGENEAACVLLGASVNPSAPPELHANLAFAQLETGHADLARESWRRALAAGAEARNPRIVALERLLDEAERPAVAATKP